MSKQSEAKKARFPEGKSVDVAKWLRDNGHAEAAEKWEKYEGEMDGKKKAAIVAAIRKAKEREEREAKFEKGKSVDVGKWLRDNGHTDAAEKWEKYEGEMDGKQKTAFLRRVITAAKVPADAKPVPGTDLFVSTKATKSPIRGQKPQFKIYNKHGGVLGGAPNRDDAVAKAKSMAKKTAAAARGKVQEAVMKYMSGAKSGQSIELTDMVRHPSFRGVNFGKIQKAVEVLDKKGLIKYQGTKVTKVAAEGDKWKKMPKGWTDESRKKFWESLTSAAPKHKVSECIKRMDGKVDDPGAFCAALADRVVGKKWREEAAKDRAKKAAPDWKAVAKKLYDARKGKSQDDFHYRAYMRAIMQGQPAAHLVKKYKGAKEARDALIDEAGKAPKKASDEWLSIDEVRELCPPCADKMAAYNLTQVKASTIRLAMAKQAKPNRKLMERLVLELQDFPHSTWKELHNYATSTAVSPRKPMSATEAEVKAALDALVEMGAVVLRGRTYDVKGGRGVWKRADFLDELQEIQEWEDSRPLKERQMLAVANAMSWVAEEAKSYLHGRKRTPRLMSSQGGAWPQDGGKPIGFTDTATLELFPKQTRHWSYLKDVGIRTTRDFPRDVPVAVFLTPKRYQGVAYTPAMGTSRPVAKRNTSPRKRSTRVGWYLTL